MTAPAMLRAAAPAMLRAAAAAAVLLALPALAGAAPAAAPKPRPAPPPATAPAAALAVSPAPAPSAARPATGPWSLEWRLSAMAGGFSGRGTRLDSGGLLDLRAALTPTYRSGRFKLEVPLRLATAQTFGASLSDTALGAAVVPEWRLQPKLRVHADAGISGARRPDWPDQYQRDAAGDYAPTDRYSYAAWHVGGGLWFQPVAHQHLRAKYRYVSYEYRQDPAFDPALPMHLTPRNNGQHQLDLSYRLLRDGGAVAIRLDAAHRQDSVYLAKHAGTGLTGGYTTPYQQLDRLEPSVEAEWEGLGGVVDLSLQYGYRMQRDAYEGYYSYQAHHPTIVADWQVSSRLSLRLRAEAWLLTYGSGAYAATEDGQRRFDRKIAGGGALRYALQGGLTVKAEADLVGRTTNYPDTYHDLATGPNGYGQYTLIDYDYTNWRALAGVEWRR